MSRLKTSPRLWVGRNIKFSGPPTIPVNNRSIKEPDLDENNLVILHLIPRLVDADAPEVDNALAMLNVEGETVEAGINPIAVRILAMLGRWTDVVDDETDVEPMLFDRYELVDDEDLPPAAMPALTIILRNNDIEKQTAQFYTEEAIAGANVALKHILDEAIEQDTGGQSEEA